MKLLVVAALVVMAFADRPGSGDESGTPVYRYGTPAGAQSQYNSSPASSGYGLKSRRRPFQSSLKPLNGGYKQHNGGSSQNNGGYSSQSNGGYSSQSNGGNGQQPFRSYTLKPTVGSSQQPYSSSSNGGHIQQSSGRYTPRYSGSSSQQPSRGYGRPEPTPAPQPYSFSYDVLDVLGNDYGAAEESNGEQVQGQYSVLLPDGRLQTVSYSVQADSGFVADVQYDGEARFLGADGQEQGRSSVTRGAGPTGGHRYGDN